MNIHAKNNYQTGIYILWFLICFLWINAATATTYPDSIRLFDPLKIELPEGITYQGYWKYHSGNNHDWTNPNYDDSDWETIEPFDIGQGQPESGWQGSGWFRLHLNVDSTLWEKPVALTFRHLGAVEIYLDGELKYKFGTVGTTTTEEIRSGRWFQPPLPIIFSRPHHLFAIHYSNHKMELSKGFDNVTDGFIFNLGDFNSTCALLTNLIRRATAYQMFFTGLPLAFCLIHFLLFLFYPQNKSNLYFSLFALSMAMLTFFVFQAYQLHSSDSYIINFYIFKLTAIGMSITGLLFIYSLFYPRLPKQFWVFLIIGILLAIISKRISHSYAYIYTFLAMLEQIRTVVVAFLKKREGTGIIGFGYIILTVCCIYQMGTDFELLPRIPFIEYYYLWGFLGMLIFISIFLARQFARINFNLERQIEQIKELSDKTIEQERKAKEQETTRIRLEEENKRKEIELQEAEKRQKVMDELERTNKELEQAYVDIKDTHSQLVQSEKMASLGILVAGVAHEINTPVGAMSSMHNTLVRAFDKLKTCIHHLCPEASEEEQRASKLFKIIEDSNKVISSGADRVTNIVKRLKSFARLDEAEFKKVDIHEGMVDTLTIVHHELKHKAEVVKNFGNIPPIACYPSQLNQVYVNILINAVQAIKDKGTITITTFLEDEKVHIKIADTGAGIPQESLSKIFDPGFTTKGVGVGTGLGLSICYQIINDHHGEIGVESEVGVGTTFTIILPTNLDEILET